LFSLGGVSIPLIDRLESRDPALRLDAPGLALRADAIVVLGAGRSIAARDYNGRDVVSPAGFLRLRYAVDIQRRTQKPILTTGGAPDHPGPSEARLMADALWESFGTRARWMEERSDNTSEDARYSFQILAPGGIRKIFLVTHAAHMARARRAFENAGFEVVPAPMGYLSDRGNSGSILSWIPSAMGVEISSIYFHETIGALWYRLTGAY